MHFTHINKSKLILLLIIVFFVASYLLLTKSSGQYFIIEDVELSINHQNVCKEIHLSIKKDFVGKHIFDRKFFLMSNEPGTEGFKGDIESVVEDVKMKLKTMDSTLDYNAYCYDSVTIIEYLYDIKYSRKYDMSGDGTPTAVFKDMNCRD